MSIKIKSEIDGLCITENQKIIHDIYYGIQIGLFLSAYIDEGTPLYNNSGDEFLSGEDPLHHLPIKTDKNTNEKAVQVIKEIERLNNKNILSLFLEFKDKVYETDNTEFPKCHFDYMFQSRPRRFGFYIGMQILGKSTKKYNRIKNNAIPPELKIPKISFILSRRYFDNEGYSIAGNGERL